MGSSVTKPKLKDQSVENGGNITFSWKSNCSANSKWMKEGWTLEESARIKITELDDTFKLMIKNAEEEDEGEYTLMLENWRSEESGSATVKVLEYDHPWREFDLISDVTRFFTESKPRNPDIKHLHFLLLGPIGAGKSSFINSIKSVFGKHIAVEVVAGINLGANAISLTQRYKTYNIMNDKGNALPFVFSDMIGLEDGEMNRLMTADIVSALKGELPQGHKFSRTSSEMRDVDNNTICGEKIHCLLNVISAETINSFQHRPNIIRIMNEVRKDAIEMGIPHAVVMTHIDKCCNLVKKDLKHVYTSKKIKQTMQSCSQLLGIPMNSIFPVKNYHEETRPKDITNSLLLDALQHIVQFANDYVSNIG